MIQITVKYFNELVHIKNISRFIAEFVDYVDSKQTIESRLQVCQSKGENIYSPKHIVAIVRLFVGPYRIW